MFCHNQISVVIPAAGVGRRMKSYGPKPLIKLNNETVIRRQIRLIRHVFPKSSVVAVTGFESERVRKSLPTDVRVVNNHDYEHTNVSRSVLLGLSCCPPGPVLVVYGDLVFDIPTIACLNTPGLHSAVLVDRRVGVRTDEVGVNVVGGKVVYFSHGLSEKWGHICLMGWREQSLFCRVAQENHRSKQYAHEILNEVIDRGGEFLAVYPPKIVLTEIDSSKDLAAARKISD